MHRRAMKKQHMPPARTEEHWLTNDTYTCNNIHKPPKPFKYSLLTIILAVVMG